MSPRVTHYTISTTVLGTASMLQTDFAEDKSVDLFQLRPVTPQPDGDLVLFAQGFLGRSASSQLRQLLS
jgi:hypothetical protein